MSENEKNYESMRVDNVRLVEGLMAYLEEYYLPKLDEEGDKQYGDIIDSVPKEMWLNDLTLDELTELFRNLTDFARVHGVDESEITAERLRHYKLLSDNKVQRALNRMENDPKYVPKGDDEETRH